ncbi:hypothetical protein FRX31_021511 [Thalictrum thalictroides]|uniref:Pentatricopeptide repeat-containing protein n=1 Tax=Thalictrum thalictroides TaxID=46969 RepID=A0A7J6VX62_THATH|nr:hypothetical protein FRX31_021511 [Thalictrum thalictroides]
MLKMGYIPDDVVYGVLIKGLNKQERMWDALRIKRTKVVLKMYSPLRKYNIVPDVCWLHHRKGVVPDIAIYNVLLGSYFIDGRVEDAAKMFPPSNRMWLKT